jgi:pilus assembly protein TadC
MRRRRRSKEIQRAVKEVSRDVAETREQFLSVAEGMNIVCPPVFLTT